MYKILLFSLMCYGTTAFLQHSRRVRNVVTKTASSALSSAATTKYSTPDQPARFAKGKEENNQRMLNIDSLYDPSYVKGKTCLVTGGNRGIGLAITKELVAQGAIVYITTRQPVKIDGVAGVIDGIEMTDNNCGNILASKLGDTKIDILINNAGYFYEPVEKIDSLNFDEEMKMIDICALGPLRVTSGLFNGKKLTSNARVIMITSQGGSITWRTTQNPTGHDYGHHMSKAAANMMSVLLAQELKSNGIAVGILHPGFNKTDMTKKYSHIWEIEGAVDSSVGAKRVVHEIGATTLDRSGKFINCEDGLEIPW